MKKYLVISTEGLITQVYQPSYGFEPEEGWQNGNYIKRITDNISTNALLTQLYWDFDTNSLADMPTPRPSRFAVWQNKNWVLDHEAILAEIREKRLIMLKESDWTQLPDSPLTDAQKAEWQTYRQALRDVPINNSSVTSLEEVVWPTEPA